MRAADEPATDRRAVTVALPDRRRPQARLSDWNQAARGLWQFEMSVIACPNCGTPWRGPRKMVAPAVEAQARERPDELKVVELDVDTASEISERFGVQG